MTEPQGCHAEFISASEFICPAAMRDFSIFFPHRFRTEEDPKIPRNDKILSFSFFAFSAGTPRPLREAFFFSTKEDSEIHRNDNVLRLNPKSCSHSIIQPFMHFNPKSLPYRQAGAIRN
jgi:hypothetical protein